MQRACSWQVLVSFLAHSSTKALHLTPGVTWGLGEISTKLFLHRQRYPSGRSIHSASGEQLWDPSLHSFLSESLFIQKDEVNKRCSQTRPGFVFGLGDLSKKPSRHMQMKDSSVSTQMAFGWQSCFPLEHSSVTVFYYILSREKLTADLRDGMSLLSPSALTSEKTISIR